MVSGRSRWPNLEREPVRPPGNPFPNGRGLADSTLLPPKCQEAVTHLRGAIVEGKDWSTSLLEAMGLWTLSEEVRQGRIYRYLIQEEAFDWRLLAQRLLRETDGLIPASERQHLLRTGRFPQEVSTQEVRRCLGVSKYQAYLNFWYGVNVEAALQMAVRDEVRKERLSRGFSPRTRVTGEVFRRIYGEQRSILLERFREERGPSLSQVSASGQLKEFTYWLFKLRLDRCEGARIASDTRKGLEWLHRSQVGPPLPPW